MANALNTLHPGDKIAFRPKRFTFVRELGAGGTGTTGLFREDETGVLFAIKKYDPKGTNDPKKCYERFVGEAKLLMSLTHPNIVRVFDSYLYPDLNTGFLQMEYVDGVPIDRFKGSPASQGWNEIFSDLVSAFETMESKGVLHRDIRPENILIDNEGSVKVIDFGFGKSYSSETSEQDNSVLLNWPWETPDEVAKGKYDRRTEIYYLGKLMKHVVPKDDAFDYRDIVERMSNKNPDERYQSFSKVREEMSGAIFARELFTEDQKAVYLNFAEKLVATIGEMKAPIGHIKDAKAVIAGLEHLLEVSLLEDIIQGNDGLISCFTSYGYKYYSHYEIPVELVRDFYIFFAGLSDSAQQHVLQGLCQRLDQIKRSQEFDEDIPF